jgi:hydroxymethylbilane synthase
MTDAAATAASSATGPIRVGTRASLLARTQTGWVVERLERLGLTVVVEMISTTADVRADVPIAAMGGDGVFVRELERALLEERIDLAVHSLKDMPTEATPGLAVACVPRRATPFDVLVSRGAATLETLPVGAVVGTSSIRRVAQVRLLRGDLVVRALRGNVDTRLRKLDAGEFDCLVLAGAGLERLGLAHRISQVLRPDTFWPAVSQGALGLQIRTADERLRGLLRPLDDRATHDAVRAERSLLASLAGGCLAPIAAWAREAEGRLHLGGCVLEDRGDRVDRVIAHAAAAAIAPGGAMHGEASSPEALGRRVADDLLGQGAAAMIGRVRGVG